MTKLRLLFVGAVVSLLTVGLVLPASAAFNHKRWKECLATGTAARYCCEQAGGEWEYRKFYYKGKWYAGYGCNSEPKPKASKASGGGYEGGGVYEQPEDSPSEPARPEQAPRGGAYEEPQQVEQPVGDQQATDSQVHEKPQRDSRQQDEDAFASRSKGIPD